MDPYQTSIRNFGQAKPDWQCECIPYDMRCERHATHTAIAPQFSMGRIVLCERHAAEYQRRGWLVEKRAK